MKVHDRPVLYKLMCGTECNYYCEILSPHGGDCENYLLLGGDAVQSGQNLVTFRRNVLKMG